MRLAIYIFSVALLGILGAGLLVWYGESHQPWLDHGDGSHYRLVQGGVEIVP